jgi:phospholipase C
MPDQEEGTKPARALPYQPDAWVRVQDGSLELTAANSGAKSVHLALYPYSGEFDQPLQLDVHGTASRRIPLRGDAYNLVLIGPNGFRREFAGSLQGRAGGVQLTSAIEAEPRKLRLQIANSGQARVTLQVRALAYGDKEQTVPLEPGQSKNAVWPLEDSHGWYDLEITCPDDPAFARRLMGHVENGRPSITG